MSNAVTKVQHTPGPWVADEDGNVTHNAATIAHVHQVDDFPCLGGYSDNVAAELQANAKLVAAAPELLDALRNVDAVIDATLHGNPMRIDMALALRVREAIAKADGCNV